MPHRVMLRRQAARAVRILLKTLGLFVLALPCWGEAPVEQEMPAIEFVESAAELGIDFVHHHCGSGEKYLVETMGAGAGWLDFDSDGWLDLFLVQGAKLPGCTIRTELRDRLYRNLEGAGFEDVTEAAGIRSVGYGQGVAVGDYDNDGNADLYVANFGLDALFRNLGDGTFEEVTAAAGISNSRWASSAAFLDVDSDGDLDLFVANYLKFSLIDNIYCGAQGKRVEAARPDELFRLSPIRAYCHPEVYPAAPDRLYLNNGDGTFSDISAVAGIADEINGKGLGVVPVDFDLDGDLDLYIANDATMNLLFRNDGNGRFEDISLLSGTGFNAGGEPESGMGVDAADIDGDGRPELFVTNLSAQTNTLYTNLGDGLFSDETHSSGLGRSSYVHVGFGVRFFEYDNDGRLDLFVGNGHVIDNIERTSPSERHAQPPLLFRGDGNGRFVETSEIAGEALHRPIVARAVAIADYDNDGDNDVLVTTNDGPPSLFINSGGARAGEALLLRLIGQRSNRDAIGARIEVDAGRLHYVRDLRGSGSYQASGDQRVLLGLGSEKTADLTIHWPSGRIEQLPSVAAGRILTIFEESGVIASEPLRPENMKRTQ